MNMRREEWHAAELKARAYERQAQIDRLREVLAHESRIKDAEIDRLHKANEELLRAQQANCSVQSSGHEQLVAQVELLQELLRIANSSLAALEEKCKSQERELETLRIEDARKFAAEQDARKSAAEQEAEMHEMRAQWEEQMQELRGLHSEHLKGAAVKDQLFRELEQTKAMLQKREELLALLQANFEDERKSAISKTTQERKRIEEELSQMKQLIIKDSDRNIGRQQEELMMLIGTVRRKEEDEKRYLQQVQQLRDALMQERMRMEEEMSHVKQRIKDSDRNIGRQQEELMMLHDTVRLKEEDEKRYLQQVQQLRDLISDKEEAYKVLLEQNIALVQEIRAKEDKIALLQSDMNETRDLRALVQEHDVIVERFRAQVLGLQTENSRLKFAGDQMKVEVNKIGDELRLQVMNLQQSEDAGRQKQREAEVEAERRIEMCKRVVQRMMRHQLLVAWNMFRDTVIETQHNRETIRTVLLRMTHRTLAGAFDCYAGAVQTVLARRERVARTMARRKKTGLKRAMEAWTEYVEIVRCERAQEAQELARQSMKDMLDQQQEKAGLESGRRIEMCKRIVARILKQQLALAWSTFVECVVEHRHSRETIHKVLLRMTHRTLACAFDCYAGAVQTVLARRERVARTMARRKKTGLKRAMEAWTEYVEIVRCERAQEAQELARQSMKDMVDKRAQEAQELARQSMPDVVVRLLRPLARQSVQDMVDLQEQVQRWQEGLDLVAHQSQQAMEEQVRLALHAINRQDEERHELKMELIVAREVIEVLNQVVEELKDQVQKLVGDAESKHKAIKELQSMMRGKEQLEKQGLPAI
jgi:hypothetical protein